MFDGKGSNLVRSIFFPKGFVGFPKEETCTLLLKQFFILILIFLFFEKKNMRKGYVEIAKSSR